MKQFLRILYAFFLLLIQLIYFIIICIVFLPLIIYSLIAKK